MLAQIGASGQQAMAALQAALPEELKEVGVLVNVNELLRQVLEIETDRLLATGHRRGMAASPGAAQAHGTRGSAQIHFQPPDRQCHFGVERDQRNAPGAVSGDLGARCRGGGNGPGIARDIRLRVFESLIGVTAAAVWVWGSRWLRKS